MEWRCTAVGSRSTVARAWRLGHTRWLGARECNGRDPALKLHLAHGTLVARVVKDERNGQRLPPDVHLVLFEHRPLIRSARAPSAVVILPSRAAFTRPARGTSFLLIVKVSIGG